MSRRNRLFVGFLIAYVAGVSLLMWRLLNEIDPRYRESAEDSLVETAHLLATMMEPYSTEAGPDPGALSPLFESLYSRQFTAEIFGIKKTRVDLRAVVVDSHGKVLFHSLDKGKIGADFSKWRDVRLALSGEYGARTTPDIDNEPDTSVMYVSAPIVVRNQIVGAVTVGKPVTSLGQFVDAARHRTLQAGVTAASAALILAAIISMWLVLPQGLVIGYLRQVRKQRAWNRPGLWRHLHETAATAYRDVRDSLEGRSYAADYAQTLTHELKSPLSAIRGAAELMLDPMSDADRRRFLGNIERETNRIQELVDRMMQLAALESRRLLESPTRVEIEPMLQELAASAGATGAARGIQVRLESPGPAQVLGDALLLRQAVGNLLDNALDFSPANGVITLGVELAPRTVTITVRDTGPGVPQFAGEKVFEKFFSLVRPQSTRRSTGLGLTFVREIAHLHHGRVSLENHEDGGAIATLMLPRLRPIS